jgi:hypothetical protein
MSTNVIAPEVGEFLAAVRLHLADLDPDEQREISDGLVADLSELVAEHGVEALGDPGEYARELRAAAGLGPEIRKTRGSTRTSVGPHTRAVLDAVRLRWDRLLAVLPGDQAGLLKALQPLWWFARAWIAVQVGALIFGAWALYLVPDQSPKGVLSLLVAVIISVQLGRGRLVGAEHVSRFVVLRLGLIVLNVLAVVVLPLVLNGLGHGDNSIHDRAYAAGYFDAQEAQIQDSPAKKGVYVDGTWVSNIYPYDAQGHPLVGVQLFNQIGQPINVVTQPEYKVLEYDEDGNPVDENGNPLDPDKVQLPRVYYPWSNGATQLFNVFPLPSRLQEGEDRSAAAFTEKVRPKVGPYPMPAVPGIFLPGILTGAR